MQTKWITFLPSKSENCENLSMRIGENVEKRGMDFITTQDNRTLNKLMRHHYAEWCQFQLVWRLATNMSNAYVINIIGFELNDGRFASGECFWHYSGGRVVSVLSNE